MIKFLAILSLSLIPFVSWAKCSSGVIAYSSSSSLALDGNGSLLKEKMSINVPLSINGKDACYNQKSKLQVKTNKVKKGESIEYEITPLMADFENVPSPSINQYISVDYSRDGNASTVQIMSFLCSGETPIGVETFSDNLMALANSRPQGSHSSHVVIMTGSIVDSPLGRALRAAPAHGQVGSKFMALMESRGLSPETSHSDSKIFIPNVLLQRNAESVGTIERKLYADFHTKSQVKINGCSQHFRDAMSDLILENTPQARPFKDISISKKGKSYRMKWLLR